MNLSLEPKIILFIIIFAMVVFQWPRLKDKKEKLFFSLFTCTGIALAILLSINPRLPGPTNLIDFVFKPIVKWMH